MLDTYFPSPRIGRADDSAAPSTLISAAVDDEARDVRTEVVHCEIDLDAPPADHARRLSAAAPTQSSAREAAKHQSGWHLQLAPERGMDLVRSMRHRGIREGTHSARARRGHLTIYGVDKFPRMVDYVVPTGYGSVTPIECGWAPISPRRR